MKLCDFFYYIYFADIIIDPNETLMAMAKDNIEDVSTDKLLRRKKFFVWILRIYLIVILVFTVAIILAIAQNEFDSTILIIGGVTTSQIWLPLLMIHKIKKELEIRGDSIETTK